MTFYSQALHFAKQIQPEGSEYFVGNEFYEGISTKDMRAAVSVLNPTHTS